MCALEKKRTDFKGKQNCLGCCNKYVASCYAIMITFQKFGSLLSLAVHVKVAGARLQKGKGHLWYEAEPSIQLNTMYTVKKQNKIRAEICCSLEFLFQELVGFTVKMKLLKIIGRGNVPSVFLPLSFFALVFNCTRLTCV